MTCPLADQCPAPACAGRAWRAISAAFPDIEAFKADVVAHMRAIDSSDVRGSIRHTYNSAMRAAETECMLR